MKRAVAMIGTATAIGGVVGLALPFLVAALWPEDFTPGMTQNQKD